MGVIILRELRIQIARVGSNPGPFDKYGHLQLLLRELVTPDVRPICQSTS